MIKKYKLMLLLLVSACVSFTSFLMAGVIAVGMIPNQDPPQELIKQYDNYMQTYAPIWRILIVVFLISTVVFVVSAIKLVIKFIKKVKNTSNTK